MVDNTQKTSRKWLVAAWPGMGNAAMVAAGYLVHKLKATPITELPPSAFFDIDQIQVKGGIVAKPKLPRGVLHRHTSPAGNEVLIFIGEDQPSRSPYTYAHQLLDLATRHGATAVATFASIGANISPRSTPRPYGIATNEKLLTELEDAGIEALQDGVIAGLNGVLLGAAASREIPGVCILGEIPSYAPGMVYPKAAAAILEAFGRLTGYTVDMGELIQHFAKTESMLEEFIDQLRQQAEERGEPPPEIPEDTYDEPASETPPAPEKPIEALDVATQLGLERLFEESQTDKSKARQLKAELDRLGLFRQYEDRFLDLFKHD